MTARLLVLTLGLAASLAPGLAHAGGGCNSRMHDTTASSCMEGSVWDGAKGQCVPQPSS